MIGTCQLCNSDTHVSQHPLGGFACNRCYQLISEVAKQNKIAGGMVQDSVGSGWVTVSSAERDMLMDRRFEDKPVDVDRRVE